MSRSEARKSAFYLLYQYDFIAPEEKEENMELYFSLHPQLQEADRAFVKERVEGTLSHLAEIDEQLSAHAKGWSLGRMNKVDLAILRLAVYEMQYASDVPVGVAINEAVELAKEYSSDKAPSFINGVLGAVSPRS